MNQVNEFSFQIPAGTFDSLEIPVEDTSVVYVLHVQVIQSRAPTLDDIGAYIMDRDSFLIWSSQQPAVRISMANGSFVGGIATIAWGKLRWGALSFRPPASGRYYLVLDNSHSQFTAKNVQVQAYWISPESRTRDGVGLVPSTIPQLEQSGSIFIPEEGRYDLIKPLHGFKREIENQLSRFQFSKNVFLMMKFRENNKNLSDYIIENLARHGLHGVRADQADWKITKDIYNPIAVLYCCKYGIAVFDEAEEHQAYSPNVAYELGMMQYQGKNCLILRHKTLPDMPFDLIKDLREDYGKDLEVKSKIEAWITQITAPESGPH